MRGDEKSEVVNLVHRKSEVLEWLWTKRTGAPSPGMLKEMLDSRIFPPRSTGLCRRALPFRPITQDSTLNDQGPNPKYSGWRPEDDGYEVPILILLGM